MIWKLLYNIIIVPVMWIGFQIYGLVNRKAAKALLGRKNIMQQFRTNINRLDPDNKRVWFHSSSMGEFEQAKPIIAELKRRKPDVKIIASFFSPSGYEHSLSYKLADMIVYIPFDSYSNAKTFLEIMKPTAAVFMRYDIWPNHLWALQRLGVPTFIANATLQEKLYRNIPVIRQFIRSLYNSLDYILTVSENDKKVFEKFHLINPTLEVMGDTRYDQVWKRSAESKNKKLINQNILAGKKVFVIGSSWKEDEEQLIQVLIKIYLEIPQLMVILVPHEPTEENLEFIENELNGKIRSIRFSHMHEYNNEQFILVDSVGNLMVLYQYGHVAYVGGGFGNGIHNVLEPAAYGIPVVFGPRHLNSQEAIAVIRKQAGLMGSDSDELYNHIKLLLIDDHRQKEFGNRAAELIRKNVGATERILSHLEKIL